MQAMLWVMLGGAVGALSRYQLSQSINQWSEKYGQLELLIGTLVVNILGCFLIGVLYAVSESKQLLEHFLYLLIGVGFLGAFTTFSTFSLETLHYLHRGDFGLAVLNVGLSVVLGVAALAIGYYTVRWGLG